MYARITVRRFVMSDVTVHRNDHRERSQQNRKRLETAAGSNGNAKNRKGTNEERKHFHHQINFSRLHNPLDRFHGNPLDTTIIPVMRAPPMWRMKRQAIRAAPKNCVLKAIFAQATNELLSMHVHTCICYGDVCYTLKAPPKISGSRLISAAILCLLAAT